MVSCDKTQWIAPFAVLVLSISNTGVSAPTAVYDNTTTAVTGDWTPNGFWPFNFYAPNEPIGDEITLAGTDRAIIEFELILSSSQQTTLSSLTLALHKNDGLDGFGYPGAPGSVLWTSTISNVTVDGITTVTFAIPNVVVPDTFTWVASADSMSAGLATYDPPTVGSSGDYFWNQASTDMEWYALWFENDPVANFGAKVTAVPESTTLLLLVTGGLSAVWRRRR